ncbi:MAG: hypothetical protein ACRENG_36015, partial [bacterium]
GLDLPYSRFSRFGLVLSPVCRFIGHSLFRRLAEVVEKHEPIDFVFAHWGVGVLPEVALLKHHEKTSHLPVILNMETFPTSWKKGWREHAELMIFKHVAPYLSGVIVPGPEMAEVINKIASELSPRNIFIKPFHYPRQFVSMPDRHKLIADKEIVFMGQMDFSRSLNNVTQQIKDLASAGVIVHCAPIEGLAHPNIHFFKPFGGEALASGEIASFMRQFRACLVTYNVPRRALRFQISLPSRFLIALAAAVPILLPKNYFGAMERVVVTEGVGYTYQTSDDAFKAVTSPDWDRLWHNTRRKQQTFLFDGEQFREFLAKVL